MQRYQKGFTFIELLIVVTLMLILGTMSISFYSRFYTQNSTEAVYNIVIQTLHKAQIFAVTGRKGSNWGVHYASNTLTLFQGNSYAARTVALDEVWPINSGIGVSGLSDVVFSRATGIPDSTPVIAISYRGTTRSITINAQGGINR